MSQPNLTTGLDLLVEAAKTHFKEIYQDPPIHANEALPDLAWSPSLSVQPNKYSLIIVEASESVYPAMFNLRRTRLEKYPVPVSVYSICTEEEFLRAQGTFKDLVEAGYGLITLDVDGKTHTRAEGVPIQQIIYREQFNDEIKALPKGVRGRLAESFRRYTHNPPSGVSDITEVMEGIIVKAGAAAKSKGWLTAAEAKADVAVLLKTMQSKPQFAGAAAAIGAAQGYVSQWRNLSHHFPKNANAAAKKYKDCKHAFIEGLKQINNFRTDMSKIGLSYRL